MRGLVSTCLICFRKGPPQPTALSSQIRGGGVEEGLLREKPGGALLIPSCLARHSFLGFTGKVCERAVAKQLQDTSRDGGGSRKEDSEATAAAVVAATLLEGGHMPIPSPSLLPHPPTPACSFSSYPMLRPPGGGKYWKLPSNPSQPHSKICRVVAPAAHGAEEEGSIPPWTTENLCWPGANQHHGEEAGWDGRR